MIGYHATAARNLPSILENGLRPYPINKPWADLDPDWRGIWLWGERPTGIDWVHVALQRWLDHQDPRVALLSATFERDDQMNPRGHIYDIEHRGTFTGCYPHEEWVYHEGVKATIVWHRIPPARLTFLGVTDFSRPAGIEDFDPTMVVPIESGPPPLQVTATSCRRARAR